MWKTDNVYNADLICRCRIHIEASVNFYSKKQANNKNNYNNEKNLLLNGVFPNPNSNETSILKNSHWRNCMKKLN